jgi:acyl-CoA synthetase (NDP forming)
VFSAGFEEVDGGKAVAGRLAEAARKHNVAVLGPNCQGVWSVRRKTMLTFSPAAMNRDKLEHAPIAVVSQSGALAGAIANALHNAGTGCSYIVSVGNETCLDALDALECMVEQDDVRVVALYIEGLSNAARILSIAERARQRGVQIVILKAGRSVLGQQATASHTGKIASSHAVYAQVLEQAGVISVDSLGEVLTAMEVFAFLESPRASGDPKGGIAVLSSSGGAGALIADHSSELDVPLSEFSPTTAAELDKILPDIARKANPIDLTGHVLSNPKLFEDACVAVGRDPRTEAVVIQFSSGGRRYLKENAEAFKSLARNVPVVVSFVGDNLDRDARREFLHANVLLAFEPALAMRALALLYRRQRFQALPKLRRPVPLPIRAAPRDWTQTMQFCEEAGITPAKWVVLRQDDRALEACANMNYPLVVKVLPSESEHKTELGLVKLRVQSADEVDAYATEFRARLGKPSAGILVQEMIEEGVEVVVSCLRGSDFGPIVSIGTGGVAIELYRDVASLALPVSEAQVLAALRGLKLWTLLQGFRGKPGADVQALVRAAVRFGDMVLACPDVQEFEINPVIVRPAGHGLSAVDALVTSTASAPRP